MKPQSPKTKSNRSDASEKRDLQAAQQDEHSGGNNPADTNLDSFGEPIDGGRNSAGTATESRRAETG